MYFESSNSERKIYLTTLHAACGVRTAIKKLYKGLAREGFQVKIIDLSNSRLINKIFADHPRLNKKETGAIIYMGSITPLSHLSCSLPKLLFVHGFIKDQALKELLYSSPAKDKLLSLAKIIYWNSLNNIRFTGYLCHSLTSMEKNKLPLEKTVIIPQFLLKEEVKQLISYRKNLHRHIIWKSDKTYIITTYYSNVFSFRLMPIDILVMLTKKLNSYFSRKGKRVILYLFGKISKKDLSIIEPFVKKGYIKYLGVTSQRDFFKYLVFSDIYLERCLDEEIGYSSLEAGVLGTVIAKITLPAFYLRSDLSNDHAINVVSTSKLLAHLITLLEDEELRHRISKGFLHGYILRKRLWKHVKEELISRLKNVTEG